MKSSTELRFAAEADEDLVDILQYTSKTWGDAQEERYRKVLGQAFTRIARFPEIGRPSPSVSTERELILKFHTVVYRYENNVVTILRILNPRRGGR